MSAARRKRVAMLLGKRDEHDTRVRKEAETLAAAGYEVRVFSLASPERPVLETVRGVTYERVELREVTREAWRRRRRLQELRLDRYRKRLSSHSAAPERLHDVAAVTTGRADGRRRAAAGAEATARAVYRAKLRVERETYLWLLAARWHLELWAAVAEPLARFDPGVVHSHDLLTLDAGRRHTRRTGALLVYDSHELELHSRRYRTVHQRVVARVVERVGVRAARAVITVSAAIAEELSRTYGIPLPTVLLNSPPLDLSRAPAPLSVRDACGVGPEETLIVFTGALSPSRGIEQTIDAFPQLPSSFHLALMGPRKPHLEAAFLEQVAALALDDRVHLVDPVRGELVSATIATADAAVIPLMNVCRSYDLTLPNKLFEAVMAGLPIAASSLRGVGGFVRNHELGTLFDASDPASIARAIRDVVERTPPGIADRERLEHLQEEVSWESQGEVLVDLYRRLATLHDLPRGRPLRGTSRTRRWPDGEPHLHPGLD
jgi:glycogen(starch) synthase